MLRQSDTPASVEFGHFSIFPHRRQLFADGRPIALGGRAFDVLLALIEASGAVVSKDELLKQVWQGRIVEENRLAGEVAALRKAFGADRELIRTIAGRGYQFTVRSVCDQRAPAGRRFLARLPLSSPRRRRRSARVFPAPTSCPSRSHHPKM